jgi:uncharacterized protein
MLYIKDSTIPGAGMGLFTDIDIKKGEIVTEYCGEKITWKECEKRNEAMDGLNSYYLYISKNNCIDALHALDTFGRYANDAVGFVRVAGKKNNCEYHIIKKKPYIVAKKNIKAGEEIFVSYGKEYWEVMKDYFEKKFASASPVLITSDEVLSEKVA